jgi:uncharacterized membrane protein
LSRLDRIHVPGLSPENLVFFSDAIFAFAMTLLAVDIRIPELIGEATDMALTTAIIGLGPKILSFLIAFWIVGSYWINYHRLLSLIKNIDRNLVYLNLLFLMFIVLIPFSSYLIGEYPSRLPSTLLNAVILTGSGLTSGFIWIYASRMHRLIEKDLNTDFIRGLTVRIMVTPIVFLASIPIAYINPLYSEICWALIAPLNTITERRMMHNISM